MRPRTPLVCVLIDVAESVVVVSDLNAKSTHTSVAVRIRGSLLIEGAATTRHRSERESLGFLLAYQPAAARRRLSIEAERPSSAPRIACIGRHRALTQSLSSPSRCLGFESIDRAKRVQGSHAIDRSVRKQRQPSVSHTLASTLQHA